jgi:hypothetical protein
LQPAKRERARAIEPRVMVLFMAGKQPHAWRAGQGSFVQGPPSTTGSSARARQAAGRTRNVMQGD